MLIEFVVGFVSIRNRDRDIDIDIDINFLYILKIIIILSEGDVDDTLTG